jgi:hypothetical protein
MKNKVIRSKAIREKCLDCIGFPHDGRVDCQVITCPLYTWQPFRKLEPDTGWTENRTRTTREKSSPAPIYRSGDRVTDLERTGQGVGAT